MEKNIWVCISYKNIATPKCETQISLIKNPSYNKNMGYINPNKSKLQQEMLEIGENGNDD